MIERERKRQKLVAKYHDKRASLQQAIKTTESFETLCANVQQTFLERYNGLGFADDEEYFFFNNDNIFIKYIFLSNENGNECSELKEGTNTVDGETLSLRIVTNSYNRLKIEITANLRSKLTKIHFAMHFFFYIE